MKRNQPRIYLIAILTAGLILLSFSGASNRSASAGQGKGGEVIAKPKPTPKKITPKKVTHLPKKSEPPSKPIPSEGVPSSAQPTVQPTPQPTDRPTTEIPKPTNAAPSPTIVMLSFNVIDGNNHLINDLRQDQFKVYEDGVPQTILSFTGDGMPTVYGLAIDTSGSLRSIFPQNIDVSKAIINGNRTGDETYIERFIGTDKIETVQEFTTSKDSLIDGLDTMYIEGGQSAVIDGVYLAAEHVAEYKKGDDPRRRALIVVTDGHDGASYYREAQLFERLRQKDLKIFVIGFVNELAAEKGLITKSTRETAVAFINRLATDTGGRAFFPQSISELPRIANEIVRELHSGYAVSYSATKQMPEGTRRSIKVVVANGADSDKRIGLTLEWDGKRWRRIPD